MVQIQVNLSLLSCVTWGDIFNLSELWIPHLQNSNNNNVTLQFFERLNEILHLKHSELRLAHNKDASPARHFTVNCLVRVSGAQIAKNRLDIIYDFHAITGTTVIVIINY